MCCVNKFPAGIHNNLIYTYLNRITFQIEITKNLFLNCHLST